MDAIAFDPGFIGGKATPPRTSTGGGRSFDDFLPQDDPVRPAAPADKPRRSDTERSSAAERPGSRPRADRPNDRSDDQESSDSTNAAAAPATDSSPAKSPAKSPAETAGATPAATDAASAAPADGAEDAATGKPASPTVGTATTAPTPPAPVANATTGTQAPGSALPGGAAAGAADMLADTAATTPAADSGKPTAQPQTAPQPTGNADPTSQTRPLDASTEAPGKAGSVSNAPAPTAAQQFGDAARSAGAEISLHADARNASPAQAGTQAAAAQTGQPSTAMASAVAQAMEAATEPGGAPEPLTFTVSDGDLAATQALSGTPTTSSQAAQGATAAAGRPVPSPPMLAEQIAVHVQKGLQQGTDRIDIRLTPAELGRIEVRLELGQDGRVHAAIAVDRAETLELLQRDARGLERALQDAGLKTDSGGLTFNLRGEGRQQSNTGFAAGETPGGGQAEPSEPEITADFSGRRVRLDGVVDIRV